MSIPLPKEPLGSHCSVLADNTLYTVSSDAFQSISLTNGSEWQTLAPPVSTTGAACVHGNKGNADEALYLVGGVPDDATKNNPKTGFMGLQQYKFSDKKWVQITMPVPVTYNMTNHGATFIQSTQQIITFAGITGGVTTPSASTYLINMGDSNHQTLSNSAKTPLEAPLVLPWGTTGALVIGGSTTNTDLTVFDGATQKWTTLNAKLESGLPSRGKAEASLMDGDDGSRMLYTFDMSTSPTTVTTTEVLSAGGSSKVKREPAAASSSSSSQLTASDWPKYNSTGAPDSSRQNTALAYDGDMVVISGGDDNEPLIVFNARKNTWVDTQKLLTGSDDDKDETLTTQSSSSTSSSSLPSSTSSPSGASSSSSTLPSSTAVAAASSGSHGLNTVQLLFVVLGSIIGAAIILACILIFLRRRRITREHQQPGDERRDGERMSFQDRGASFMKEAGGTLSPRDGLFHAPPRPFAANNGGGNTDSWGHMQAFGSRESGYSSTTNIKDGPTVHAIGGQGVIVHPGTTPTPPGDRSVQPFGKERSSGWSRYFSGNSATNLVGLPQRTYSGAERASNFTDATTAVPHPNPYLHNAGPGVAAGGVASAAFGGTPSNGIMLADTSGEPVRRGSDISMSSVGESYSSGIPESVEQVWSPVEEPEENRQWPRGPIASSVYPDSPVQPRSRPDTQYSGPNTHSGVDNLSWLNLKQS